MTDIIKVYCTFVMGFPDLRSVDLSGYFIPILRSAAYFNRKEAVQHCNSVLLALRECKKLEFVSFWNWRCPVEEESIFKNEVQAAQSFRLRPARIKLYGIEMLF